MNLTKEQLDLLFLSFRCGKHEFPNHAEKIQELEVFFMEYVFENSLPLSQLSVEYAETLHEEIMNTDLRFKPEIEKFFKEMEEEIKNDSRS